MTGVCSTAIIRNIVVKLLRKKVVIIVALKRIRSAQRMTQAELAQKISVTQSVVGQWERGEAMPSAAKLPLLAEVLGCSIDELFGRAPPGSARDSA